MKLIKPAVPAGDSPSGGYSGIPSWRRKWIENKVRRVELECGTIEDLSIQALCFINSFHGTEIDCVKCKKFCQVKRTLKSAKVQYPDNPLF